MSDGLGRDELIRRLAERVAPDNPDRAAKALARSPELAGDLTWLAELFAASELLPLQDVPPEVSSRLHRMYRESLSIPMLAEEAIIIHDSRHGEEMLVGVRADGGDDVWTLMLTAPSADVVLDGRPGPAGTEVTGQVLVRTGESEVLAVEAVGPATVATSTDDFGQFDLGVLSPGSWELAAAGPRVQLQWRFDI